MHSDYGNRPNMSTLDNPLLNSSSSSSIGAILLISIHNFKSFLLPHALCHDWSYGTLRMENFDYIFAVLLLVVICYAFAQLQLVLPNAEKIAYKNFQKSFKNFSNYFQKLFQNISKTFPKYFQQILNKFLTKF